MKRIVVGISGASGTHLACRFVSQLKQYTECEVHVVVTDSGRLTASYEEPELFDKALALADNVHSNASLGESIASGTFKTEGMVIIPCSMKTVAGIASGYSDNLLLRAADVTLKEQRPLVLVARETPMNAIHLRNLAQLASVPGITLMPPMMTYYHNHRRHGRPTNWQDIRSIWAGISALRALELGFADFFSLFHLKSWLNRTSSDVLFHFAEYTSNRTRSWLMGIICERDCSKLKGWGPYV